MNRLWMIAEDDPVIRMMLVMIMELWEVEALVFEDGYQAWRWLDEVERGNCDHPLPEVALIDIRMPGHQGHEVGQRMRAISATSGIPLILMSAYHLTKEDMAEIVETANPDQFIPKPFPDLDEFRALIEETIQASKAMQEPKSAFTFGELRQIQVGMHLR